MAPTAVTFTLVHGVIIGCGVLVFLTTDNGSEVSSL
ncbi:hypothetical protein CASFOL_034959 [Castilleja foliolosa]|uniref:Photosystem II protein N n=1 Tax=Castilleja foliolosa TaxID=1961234 RepID=A0ABD3BS14_9LAMI